MFDHQPVTPEYVEDLELEAGQLEQDLHSLIDSDANGHQMVNGERRLAGVQKRLEAAKIFLNSGVEATARRGVFHVTHAGREWLYYPKKAKWQGANGRKIYRSKGPQDFLDRFVFSS